MKVGPAYILVFVDDIRLVPVAEFFEIFPCDPFQLFIGELIFRRRVQRDMHDRVFDPVVGLQIRFERAHAMPDTGRPLRRLHDTVSCQHLGRILIYLLLVICEGTVQRGPSSDLGDHTLYLYTYIHIQQHSYPGSLLPAQVFLLELFAQMQDLFIGFDQLHRVPLQFVKRRKGFPFRQAGVDGFDHLVIIHAYSPILALQVGQFHVIVHRPLVDPDHFERTIENGREDELRFGLSP